MFSKNQECQSFETTEVVLSVTSTPTEADAATIGTPTRFYGHYCDCMEMRASVATVAEYFNNHAVWFSRCAEPMKVEPLGSNGYALVIGRFGSFGYEVEPKIGLELLPPEEGIYHIRTISIPDYHAPGYDVNYQASVHLVDAANDSSNFSETQVKWELNLIVDIHFPKFIQRLPKSLIQSTGDRLLNSIVRQISRRLTSKVQEDFYQSLGIPFPGNSKSTSAISRE